MDINGGRISLKAGEQLVDQAIIIGDGVDTPAGDIVIEGQGPSTVLKRGLDLAPGVGLFNVYGYNITFRNLVIDGMVTTSTAIDYTLMSDPIADALTASTSIWIHPGSANIRFENVWIRNTGGYAILLDARTADIEGFEFIGGGLENCRPNLISYPAGDGGGWNGGIFAKHLGTSGTSGAVKGMLVQGASFKRMNGNAIWSHSNGFEFQHRNLIVTNCDFQDLCRDGVQPGNFDGGSVSNNNFYRVGYITTTDTDSPAPNWPTGAPNAVALDTTGLAKNFKYNSNTFVDINGTCIDGDGIHDSAIQSNTMSVSDSVSGYGPGGIGNYSTGIQPSNSYYKWGGRNLTISGNTIRNMGNTAISGSNLKNCQITANNIVHPASAALAPIVLFNKPGYDGGSYTTGNTDSAYRSHGNVITNNRIEYSGSFHAIEEITLAGGADYAFKSADVNVAFNNSVTAAPGEFKKDSNSSSFIGLEFSTVETTSTSPDVTRIQREGTGTTAATKTYKIVAGTKTQLQQLSDAAFLNLSVNGAANTGVVATGNRSTTAFDDCVATGKIAGDGFLSLTDTTFDDADADLLDDSYGLLRYNSTDKKFQISVSLTAGNRDWMDLTSAAVGATGYVQFANSGALASSSNFAWNNAAKVLTITGTTGTASIVAATSYIQSQEGFYSPGTSASTVNIPNGGVTTLSLISVRNDGDPGLNLIRNSGSNQRSFGIGVNASGKFFISDETATATRLTLDSSGLFSFGSTVSIDQSGNISASATVAAAGVNVSGISANSLQVPAGGLLALTGTFDSGIYLKSATGTPATPSSAYAAFAHKTGNVFHYYDPQATTWKTVDFSNVGTGVTSLTGTTNQISVSASSGSVTLSLPQNVHSGATPTFASLSLTGSATNTLSLSSGSISAVGIAVTGVNYNSIQAPSGGVYAGLGLTVDQAIYLRSFSTSGGLNSPASGYGGLAHKSGTTYWLYTGSTWTAIDLSTVGGGVTSLAAGTGISVSGSTGAVTVSNSGVTNISGTTNQVTASASTGGVTLSLPQSIHTGATPTFSTLTISSSASNAIAVTGSVSAAGYAASGSATNSIQSPSGGVSGKYLIGTTSLTLVADSSANAGLSSGGQGRLYFDSGLNRFRVSENGGSYVDLIATGVNSITGGTGISVSGTTSVTISNSGVTSISGTTNQVTASASTGGVTLSLPQNIHSGATPTFSTLTISSSASNAIAVTGSVSAAGFAASGSSTNQIQCASGGVSAKYLIGTTSFTLVADTSTNAGLSGAGQGRLYFDSGLNRFRVSENGGSYVDLIAAAGVTSLTAGTAIGLSASSGAITISNTGVTSLASGSGISVSASTGGVTITNSGVLSLSGTANRVTVSGSTGNITLSGPQDIHTSASPAFAALNLSSSATNALELPNGYITAKGLISTATAFNSVQTAGGVLAAGLTSSQSIYLSSFGTATMNTPAVGYGAISHKTGTQYWLWNGSSWAAYDFASIGGGVTSVTAGSGISVSGSTGAITVTNSGVTSVIAGTGVTVSSGTGASTISIGQAVGTSSTVQHAALGLGTSPSVPLHIIGNSSREVARFVSSTDASNNRGYFSLYTTNPGFWWEFSSEDSAGGGTANGLAFRERSGSGTAISRVYFAQGGNVLIGTQTDDSSGAKLQVSGFVSTTTGFYTGSTNFESFKTLGGVHAKQYTLTSKAAPGLSAAGTSVIYHDSTSNQLLASVNGGSYVNLIGTSYSAGTGVSIASNVISIGQAVGTSSNVQFATIKTTGNVGVGDTTIAKGRLSVFGSNGFAYSGFNIKCNAKFSADANGAILFGTTAGANTSGYTRGFYWGFLSEDFGITRYKDDETVTPIHDFFISPAGTVMVATTGDDSSGAKLQINGFVSATTGYYSVSTSYQALQAPSGGVYTRSGHFDKYIHIAGNSGTPTATSGTSVPANGMIFYDTSLSKFRAYEGSTWKDLISSSYSAGTGVGISGGTISIGQAVSTSSSVTFGQLQVESASLDSQVYISSGAPRIALGNNSTYASRTVATRWVMATSGGHFGLPTAGDAWIFTEGANGGTAGNLYLGAALTTLVKIAPTQVTIAGSSGVACLNVTGGYISSAQGFATASTNYDSIQTANGFLGKQLTFTSKANPGTSTSGNCVIYMDSTSGNLMASVNGGAFTNMLGGSSGVTSLSASTGISVSASTGSISISNSGVTSISGGTGVSLSGSTGGVTVSIGQAVSTSSSVTFGTVTSSGVVQSSSTGSSIAFQTTNFNLQMDGNGNISGAGSANMSGGYKVSGTTVINSSRQFVGAGIDVGSNGVNAAGYNINGGYTGQTWNISINGGSTFAINGSGTYSTIQIRGGVVTNAF